MNPLIGGVVSLVPVQFHILKPSIDLVPVQFISFALPSLQPYQVYGHSPVLACANSKSGDNLGVKFLRRLKFWLNPTQVFDLAITGPDLG